MDALILRNVRCFREPAPIPLAPLTVLVGENSTGKTTFLAAIRIAWRLARSVQTPDFNEKPFLLGAYEQIANYRGAHGRRAASFEIGFEANVREAPAPEGRSTGQHLTAVEAQRLAENRLSLVGRFENRAGQPSLVSWQASGGGFGLEIQPMPSDPPALYLTYPRGRAEIMVGAPPLSGAQSVMSFLELLALIHKRYDTSYLAEQEGPLPELSALVRIKTLVQSACSASPQAAYAFAPIRTQPERTYDLLTDAYVPQGRHAPMILARFYEEAKRQPIVAALDRFGRASGLFEHLTVERLGKQESSPFQLMVKFKGPAFNMVDVGYGVSQILPIIVDTVRGDPGTMFLLQQPEVHLHPRAQAELGTLLAQLVKKDKKRFVVETHSDHLVDRIRMDVRDGKGLKPSDVSILWFERTNGGVEVHPLKLDEQGNIVNVPPGYREFFLNEERRFLGG